MELKWFEDIEIGTVTELGSYQFTEKDIINFASKFDPQPCHCDPEQAVTGPFGGIIASGWHITSVWMQLMIARNPARSNMNPRKDEPRGGGSPGFLDLQWFEPVRPGDTVSYKQTTIEKIELRSRPEWGIVRSSNQAFNQDGARVLRVTGQGMISRKPT